MQYNSVLCLGTSILNRPALRRLIWLALILVGVTGGEAQDFNAALDNPSLSFTATGAWNVSAPGGKDGEDAIVNVLNAGGAAELRTMMSGPGWLVFWKSHGTSSTASMLVDGVAVESYTSSDSVWVQRGFQLAPGTHEVVWRVSAGGRLGLDRVSMETDLSRPLVKVLPGFTWTTGGDVPWVGRIYPAVNLTGRAMSSLPYSETVTQTSWIETAFSGPGRLTWQGSGNNYTDIKVVVDGVSQCTDRSGFSGQMGICDLPPGSHTVRWLQERRPSTYDPNALYDVWLDSVTFTPGTVRTFSEALNVPGLEWTTGGDAGWDAAYLPATGYLTAEDAAKSGLLAPGGQSWLETTVTGPGVMDSRGDLILSWGTLQLLVDGAVMRRDFYQNSPNSVRVGPGTHAVRWLVQRDTSPWIFGRTVRRVKLDTVTWRPVAGVPLAEALDVEGLTLSTPSSSMNVFGQENAGFSAGDDGVLLRNGGVLECALTGPAKLNWNGYGMRPVTRIDGLIVKTTDSSLQDYSSGELEVPPGSHLVTWTAPVAGNFETWIYSLSLTPATGISLTQALGAGGLTWQASPEVSSFSADGGVACIFLPQPGTQSRLYGLETTVAGPGVMNVRWKNRSDNTPLLQLNGIEQSFGNSWSVETWVSGTLPIPSGNHVIRITPPLFPDPTHRAGTAFAVIEEASWKAEQPVPLADALDAPALTFTTGGPAAWEGVATPDGSRMARLSFLQPGQTASLETTVTGPGLLRFLPSLTGNYPYTFTFKTGGVTRPLTHGGVNWLEVPEGAQTLRWEASLPTGATIAAGQSATLDEVSWTPYHVQPLSAWAPGTGLSLTTSDHEWSMVAGPDLDGGGSAHPVNGTTSWPVWIEAAVTGPAVIEFSLFGAGIDSDSFVSVNMDNGARVLNAHPPAVNTVWSQHTLFVPNGAHTVRWSLPALQHLVWLDGLRVRPASADFSAAAELPETTWSSTGERRWFAISDPALPDGDVIACEAGLEWNPYVADSLTLQIVGPGELKLNIHGATRPGVSLTGYPFPPPAWLGTWEEAGNGWSRMTMVVPGGTQSVSISPATDEGIMVDGAEWTPLAPVSLANAFPLAGAAWSTSPANPVLTLPANTPFPDASAICRVGAGQESAWLEASLSGPGTFTFSTQLFSGDGRDMAVKVDGDFQQSGSQNKIVETGYPSPGPRYVVHLPAGPHTIRWEVSRPSWWDSGETVLLRLHDFSFEPATAFTGAAPSAGLTFFHQDKVATQLLNEAGQSFVRISAVTIDEYSHRVLSAWAGRPGYFKFRWRSDAASDEDSCRFYLSPPSQDIVPLGRTLSGSLEWREMQVFVPPGGARLQWFLPTVATALDLTDMEFHPMEAVPLDVALGVPGIAVNTDPAAPWTGLRQPAPDDQSFAVPPLSSSFGSMGWIEAAITGPAILSWREWYSSGYTELNGGDIFVARSFGEVSPDFAMRFTLIPEGTHQFRWTTYNDDVGSLTGLSHVRVEPLPAAYVAWHPYPEWGFIPFPHVDYDRDGMTGLTEFAFDTNPLEPGRPPQPRGMFEDGSLTVTLPAPRPVSDGVRVVLETSPDMSTWETAAAEIVTPAPPGEVKYRLVTPLADQSRVYVRARVEFYFE